MAKKADIVIDAGSDFSTDIHLEDDNGDVIQLNNYSAYSVFKKWYTSSTYIPFNTFINAASGVVTLSLDANTSSYLAPGRYMYDAVIVSPSNTVSRIVEGIVTITPSISNNKYWTNNTPDIFV